MKDIGLIGLGNIGSYYTKKLLTAGYPLTVFDIDKTKLDAAAGQGAKAAASAAEVVENSDIILLSLPGSPAVESVMDSVLGVLRTGQLVIDTSTNRPSTSIRYEKLCAEKGVGFIDSPLTSKAVGHYLMVGGTKENFEKGEEILKCIGYKYKHIGKIGDGAVLKLINQAVQAGELAVHAEAVEMAKMHNIDPTLLKSYLEFNISDRLFSGEYHGGGHLALHYKDLGYLIEIAHDSGANIPISSFVHEIFKTSRRYGHPDWYQVGIQTYYKRLNNDVEKKDQTD